MNKVIIFAARNFQEKKKRMYLTAEKKREIFEKYGSSVTDTGSAAGIYYQCLEVASPYMKAPLTTP